MAPSQHLIGRTLLGRFRVMGPIGEGAMASVYFGLDLEASPPAKVAIKVMHARLMADKTFLSRFVREAKAAQKLEHPSTVKVLSHGEDGGVVFMVMELLEGRDLFDTLVAEGKLGQTRALEIMIQVTDALVCAHGAGIIHRDLKPENIMLVDDGEQPTVKVLDFGIAKLLQPERSDDSAPSSAQTSSVPSSALTVVGMVLGTPQYMSPEQGRGDPVDARSDLYACGVILFQLVTGRLPYEGRNPLELAFAPTGEPPDPTQLTPELHPSVSALITKAMARWPAQRQQTAGELKAELEEALQLLPKEAPEAIAPRAERPATQTDDPDERAPETRRSLMAPAPASATSRPSPAGVSHFVAPEPPPPTYLVEEAPSDRAAGWGSFAIIGLVALAMLLLLATFVLLFGFII